MKRFEDLNRIEDRIEKKRKKSQSRRRKKKKRGLLLGVGIVAVAIAALLCLGKLLIFPSIPALNASAPTVDAARSASNGAARSGGGTESERQIYENEYIRMEVPASWTRIDSEEGSDVISAYFYAKGVGQVDGGLLIALVSRSADAQSNYEFYQEYVNTVVAGLQNRGAVNQEITPITINDRKGYTFDFAMEASAANHYYGYVYSHNKHMVTLLYADNSDDSAASQNALIGFVRTLEFKSPSESGEDRDAREQQVYEDDYFKLKIPASWLRVDAPSEAGKKAIWYYAKEKGSIEGGYLQIYEQFNMPRELSYDDYNAYVSGMAESMQDDQVDPAQSPVNQELLSVEINGYDGYMFGFDATKGSDYFYGYVYNCEGNLICLCLTDDSGDRAAIREKLTGIANTLECAPQP